MFADQFFPRVPDPFAKRAVDLENAAIGQQREIATGRVLIEVLQILDRKATVSV
jgi:hypothetical protein